MATPHAIIHSDNRHASLGIASSKGFISIKIDLIFRLGHIIANNCVTRCMDQSTLRTIQFSPSRC